MAAVAHVVMMVANSIDNDSRVLKEAIAIARTGVRVTLLGVDPSGVVSMDCLDGSTVMTRLPARFPLREDRKRRRGRRRARRLPLVGYRVSAESAARTARIKARQADLKAASGEAVAARRSGAVGPLRFRAGVAERTIQQKVLRLAAEGVRVRGFLTRQENKLFTSGWSRWDDLVSGLERPASWRRVVPEAYDYEEIFGQTLDELKPDVLHAHDMHLVGVAARAAGRAKLRGREMKVIYDAHEYVPGLSRYGGRTPQFISAWAAHEREYIGSADRVITVSPAIARTLRDRYRLDHEPTVIINTPSRSEIQAEVLDLRSRVALPADVPLLVYSGGVTKARGVETAIEALPHLPGVHLAVVCVPSVEIGPVRELRKLAASLQVEDRVHYLDPVEPDEVVSFLRTADIGLIPILRYPSHEMALPNKVFEYIFAGLPVITSDMPSLTEFVDRTGIGEAFEAENALDLADKVRRVLADPAPYRQQASRPDFQQEVSWEGQAAALRELYSELLGQKLGTPDRAPVEPRVLIGPLNIDGQASRWARAIETHQPGFTAESLRVGERRGSAADRIVPAVDYKTNLGWRIGMADHLLSNVTHVLFESGQPILGHTPLTWFTKDVRVLEAAGIAHGVVFHAAQVRDASWPVTRERLKEYEGPRFVTTPDLLDEVEDSQWLPLVVEVGDPATNSPVLEREVPVVLQGAAADDPALTELNARGLIEYRRITPGKQADLAAVDIVVDDPRHGSYGVLACEAMAAGRVTVGQVPSSVRDQLPGELPIVQASADELGVVVERLVGDRETARKLADAGPAYVREVHDGRKTVEVLAPFLQAR